MNKDILELAAEIEKLIENYEETSPCALFTPNLAACHWRDFKSELMNIITKYE